MLHVWFYYYKGEKGHKKFFDGGAAYTEEKAIQALGVAKQWISDDDDDGDKERLTGTRWVISVCISRKTATQRQNTMGTVRQRLFSIPKTSFTTRTPRQGNFSRTKKFC